MNYLKFIILTSICIAFSLKLHSQTIEVKDSYTKQGVPNVNIQWKSAINKSKGGATTNSKGIATLASTEGIITITASCIGYKTYTDTISTSNLVTIYLEEDILNLEQVTVTGTRTPRSLKETPVLTQLVSRKDISGIKATTVNDILEMEIPSVEMNLHGYGAALSSQGLEGKYTLVLIDGERMAGENDGNIDFSRINAANIEQVEIVKGASSALYGSNAIGSVINIITKKPSKKFEVSASFRYAEPNQKNTSNAEIELHDEQYMRTFLRNWDRQNINSDISVGFKMNSVYSQTYFGYKCRDAYKLFNTKETVKYYPELDSTANEGISTTSTNIFGFADYAFSNKTGFNTKNWSGELRGNFYNHEEFDFERDNKHNIYSNYTAGGFLERNLGQRNTVKISFNHDVYNKYLFNEIDEVKEKNYGNIFNHFRATYSNEQYTNHKLLFGAEIFNEILKSDRFSSAQETHSVNDAVIIIQDEYSVNSKTTIVGGLRSGYHSAHSLHLSPSLTIKVSNGDFNYRVSYARGFRSPTLKELYMNWQHLTLFTIYGDKNLKAETSNYFALSTEYVNISKRLSITGSLSYNSIKNKIGGIWTANQTEYHYKNGYEYSVFNAELLARWKILKSLQVKGGYAYTHIPENESITLLSTTSPHNLTAQLDYNLTKGWYELNANIALKFIGKKKVRELDIDNNNFYIMEYPNYSLVNININQRFKRNYSLSIGVKNLFNYVAPIHSFYTTPTVGQRFFIAIGYDF